MTKDLLWEVGVEEIPARFLPPAIKQMEQLAREAFGEAGLAYDEAKIILNRTREALDGCSAVQKIN
mgnify:CR=1 FL=1